MQASSIIRFRLLVGYTDLTHLTRASFQEIDDCGYIAEFLDTLPSPTSVCYVLGR